jgi:hypothetical protein
MNVSLMEADCFGHGWLALLEPLLPSLAPVVALLGAAWLLGRVGAVLARPR